MSMRTSNDSVTNGETVPNGKSAKRKAIPDRVTSGSVPVRDRLIELDRRQLHAVIATESDGQPYTSLIAYALAPDAESIVFLTPRSTQKYRNILRNPQVSLLIDTRTNTRRDYLSAESITIVGTAHPIRRGAKWSKIAGILTRKHPRFETLLSSPETALVEITIVRCIHVTSFQSVSVWEARSSDRLR